MRFDEGMVVTPIELPPGWSVEHGCDSRDVAGIQLADLAAHMVSTLILGQLGLVTKMVSTEGGYPEQEVELAWELWSSIRHAMASGRPCFAPEADGRYAPYFEPFGLVISDGLEKELRTTIQQRLGGVWLGCIH